MTVDKRVDMANSSPGSEALKEADHVDHSIGNRYGKPKKFLDKKDLYPSYRR